MQEEKSGSRKVYEVMETRKQFLLFSNSLAFDDCNTQITSLPAHPAHGCWYGPRPVTGLHHGRRGGESTTIQLRKPCTRPDVTSSSVNLDDAEVDGGEIVLEQVPLV